VAVNNNINGGTSTIRALWDAIALWGAAIVSSINTITDQIPHEQKVALGLITGFSTWNKFGYNTDIDTGADEVIAEFGGALTVLSDGEQLNIVSTSASDASAGTGVQRVVIFGVGGAAATDRGLVVEVLALDGLSTATTTNYFWGVNRMTIFIAGSSQGNVGTITATNATTGNVAAEMPAGQGTTQQCVFYVPEDHTFMATWLYGAITKASGGGNPTGTIYGYVHSEVANAKFEIFRKTLDTSIEEAFEISPKEPFPIGEKSVLWFEGSAGANNTEFRCRFSGELIADQT
jgi:hypothetical protein